MNASAESRSAACEVLAQDGMAHLDRGHPTSAEGRSFLMPVAVKHRRHIINVLTLENFPVFSIGAAIRLSMSKADANCYS